MMDVMATGVEWKGKRIPCRLIVFDKDGTLVDFTATWVPLIRKRVEFLLKALGKGAELESLLLRSWGIDPSTGRVDPRGPCPVSPRSEEIVVGTATLYQLGYPWDEAKQTVLQAFAWADAASDRKAMLKPVPGVRTVLHRLKGSGFSLALATNDERRDTEVMISWLEMEGVFDVMVCAGEVPFPKPHPETLLAICRQLSIPPEETLFIGDTVADMMAGKEAGVSLTIGVLEGGVTPREDLAKVADGVLDSIRDLIFYGEEDRGE
jgi:phosphoglycolate phosphatase